ncbi:MAG: PQQ-dependent sugar dehydrogenase, partial [Bacteroidales bacterium]|nr:PQQ-dependent sugar dehydrogenase [Bacteroidales bacterium]
DAQATSRSQDPASLNGKILRLNPDGTIPSDNPNPESYVWTLGHRNPQGMVFSPSGILYSSEHGPSNDDELNIIEAGRNYGWPAVHGFCDDPTENIFCTENNVREPLIAWTPTLAVAGIGYYDNPAIPAWQHSILMTNLKASRLVAMKLSEDGSSVLNDEHYFINWWGRLRDVCVSPDGRVFLATSNRDGRGIIKAGDDRIVEIRAKSAETGIIENGTIAVKIYPNPARERLSIETAGYVITGIDIFNIAGKKLIQRELPGMHDSFTMDIQLEQGIYFIRIRTEHATVTERLIIEQ